MSSNQTNETNNSTTYTSIDNAYLLVNNNQEINEENLMYHRRRPNNSGEESPIIVHKDDEEWAHSRPKGPKWRGEYAKSIVYGGLDAIVTCFSLISSISAGRLTSVDVLVLGFANLVADGISMGFGDYVSSSTEKSMALRERDVTQWEVDHNGGGPEMANYLMRRYEALGMDPSDAAMVVNIFSKYKHIMVEEQMKSQNKGATLAHEDEDEEDHKPWKSGVVTFIAFIVFGSAPLLSFIILIPFTHNDTFKFIGACILSALALVILGLAKARISGENYGLSSLMTFFNGVVAAGVAYAIGWTLRNVAGLEDQP